MTSYRLTVEQIARLKSRACPASDILTAAWMRWRSGDYTAEEIQNARKVLNTQNVLQVFPTRHKFASMTSNDVRLMLQCHFMNPDKRLVAQHRKAELYVSKLLAEVIA